MSGIMWYHEVLAGASTKNIYRKWTGKKNDSLRKQVIALQVLAPKPLYSNQTNIISNPNILKFNNIKEILFFNFLFINLFKVLAGASKTPFFLRESPFQKTPFLYNNFIRGV